MFLMFAFLLVAPSSFASDGGNTSGGGQLVHFANEEFHFLDAVSEDELSQIKPLSFQDLSLQDADEFSRENLRNLFPSEFTAALKAARALGFDFFFNRPECAETYHDFREHLALLEQFKSEAEAVIEAVEGDMATLNVRFYGTDHSFKVNWNLQYPIAKFDFDEVSFDTFLFHLIPAAERPALLIHESARYSGWDTYQVEHFTRALLGQKSPDFVQTFCVRHSAKP